jgi:uncharacterized protein
MIRTTVMQNELKPFWSRFFSFDWKFGLFLILIICVPRFIIVLNANLGGNNGYVGLIMFISAIAPFVFLNKYGRKQIGITKSKNYLWLIVSFIVGLSVSIILYFLGKFLYGNSFENWYVYIGKLYKIPQEISSNQKNIMFLISTLIGITFSPIGEELFFRGIVHASFAKSIGDKKASIIDSSAFALTHISHFGLVFINNQWQFLIIPTIIWVGSMFLVSLLFFIFKKYVDSILGAIICHAAFNLGMTFSIFYLL